MEALYLSIVIFLAIAVGLYMSRPALMFTTDGRMKRFGTRSADKTIFYYPYVIIIVAILVYFILEAIAMKRNHRIR